MQQHINNAASTTATFSDNVTATITNSGTLLFNATRCRKSVTGTIAEAAGGDTTEIKVIDSADGAPATVTFHWNSCSRHLNGWNN